MYETIIVHSMFIKESELSPILLGLEYGILSSSHCSCEFFFSDAKTDSCIYCDTVFVCMSTVCTGLVYHISIQRLLFMSTVVLLPTQVCPQNHRLLFEVFDENRLVRFTCISSYTSHLRG